MSELACARSLPPDSGWGGESIWLWCSASPRNGRKTVAHGASLGKIGPYPARAPPGAKEITTKGKGAIASFLGCRRGGDVKSPQEPRRASTDLSGPAIGLAPGEGVESMAR